MISCFTKRRHSFLKTVVICSFVMMTLLLWPKSEKPDLDLDSTSKKLIVEVDSLPETKALLGNTDEFLEAVLKEVNYTEVDLTTRTRSAEPHDDYDEEIEGDLKRIQPGLGDNGRTATVPSYQQPAADNIRKKEAFNRLLSEMISYNRSVPDTREPACRNEIYDDDLPTMSIIIIYHNEAYSTLVRTLHSVINRTPAKLLKEIVLVDDFSDHRDLKGKLERYIAIHYPVGKIKLVKLPKRSGLIRARMIGAHVSAGDVLFFLDAHCEANHEWAEPLLQRIKEERTAVVCPIIDIIEDKTLQYSDPNSFLIGGFNWNGEFTWISIPPYEVSRKKYHHSPTRSPTMAGGLFAIDRKYFWEMGSYDSDMQVWGGENLEMSFRIWQCGGSVETIPCSRVGHIFRDFHPYSFPNNVDSHGLNTARLAEVWMDKYKSIFYFYREQLKTVKWGDVSKRLDFRKRKGCKSFKWYLDNVYKEKFQMWFDSQRYGQVKNTHSNQCLDNMQHKESVSEEYPLEVYPCHPQLYPTQAFLLSNKGELRREYLCASSGSEDKIRMINCEHPNGIDLWDFLNGQLYNRRSNKCLSVRYSNGRHLVMMETCSWDTSQIWEFNS